MTIAEWQRIDGEHVAESLRAIAEKLTASDGDLVLDFSAVRFLSPAALAALSQFASTAEKKRVRLVFRAVNIDVYKVLKLAKMTSRLAFLN